MLLKAANCSPKGGILKTIWLLGLYVGDNCYLCGGKEQWESWEH